MNKYTTFCTAEQIRRAYKLGAPLETGFPGSDTVSCNTQNKGVYVHCKTPTTQQMMNWLREEKHILISIDQPIKLYAYHIEIDNDRCIPDAAYQKYEQAELAAIDTALDYLEKNL